MGEFEADGKLERYHQAFTRHALALPLGSDYFLPHNRRLFSTTSLPMRLWW